MLLDQLLELLLAASNQSVQVLSPSFEHKRRHHLDGVLADQLLDFVHVNRQHHQLAHPLSGDPIHEGRDLFARAAPCREEVDNDQLVAGCI